MSDDTKQPEDKPLPHAAAPAQASVRVTKEGLEDFLSDAPTTGTFTPFTNLPGDCQVNGNGEHIEGEEEDLGTEGNHTGRNLKGKQKPERPIDQPGADPYSDRKFVGDEFQGMLTFDRQGKPTFWSRFPGAKNAKQIKELNVSIATKLPSFVIGDTSQAHDIDAMEEDAFDGKHFEEVFAPIHDRLLKQIQQYATEFEAAYGIKMNVEFDHPDPQLCIMGYAQGNPALLGFAAFPPSINEWESMGVLGHHPAHMLLNNDFAEEATDKEIYDLFSHEFGHTLGFAHPHDLALLNMDKREALTATKMAYTDLSLETFRHAVRDKNGNPQKGKDGKPVLYHNGPDEGVLDYGFRKWTAEAPVLNTVSNPDPDAKDNDLYKGIYDLQLHYEHALETNKDSLVFTTERLLPMVPMINDGKHTELRGSQGNDYIDTNPGYSSIVADAKSGIRQKFVLVEGHMEKVLGVAGNNTIIAAQAGNQEIQPGPGTNTIQFFYPTMAGNKTILSTGTDRLVITEDVLKAHNFAATQKDGSIVLDSGKSQLTLSGKGLDSILIINKWGKPLCDVKVAGMNAEQLNDGIFKDSAWKNAAREQAEKKKAAQKPASVLSEISSTPPISWSQPADSWTDRVEISRNQASSGRAI